MADQPICKVCEAGRLRKVKKHRLSGASVVIGYILLIPSLLGICLGFLLIILGIGGCAMGAKGSADAASQMKTEASNILENASIPARMHDKIMNMEKLDDSDKNLLSVQQLEEIRKAEMKISQSVFGGSAGVAASGIGGSLATIFGIFLVIGSFVGGLIGWLLTMKKWVLQCNHCSAVVNAC